MSSEIQLSKEIQSYLILIRPLNCLIVFFTVIVSGIICSVGVSLFPVIIYAALSASLSAASGNVINDFYDFESDKINHPKRPLANGILTKNESLIFYFILIAASIVLSFLVNAVCICIVILTIILLFLYSYKLKHVVLFGNFIVAFLTGMVFIFGGYAVNNVRYAVIPALFAFLINLIREVVKDMHDLEGDTKIGIKTFPFVFGYNKTKNFILTLTLVLILTSFVPVFDHFYNNQYLLLISILVNPLLVFIAWSIYRNHSKENLNKLSFLLKLNMIIGLTAIYLGK
jgi:geranylgeranylglycerol-phosphate geranylgeranyltransferase